jgi:alginate O-acetyltransferase complex protein AlgI
MAQICAPSSKRSLNLMFDNPQLYLYLLIGTVLIYWSIPWKELRLSFLLTVSLLVLMAFYPNALPVALAMSFTAWFGAWLVGTQRIGIVWPTLLSLVVIFCGARLYATSSGILVDVGLTFVLLKSLGVVIEAQRKKTAFRLKQILLLNFLYPIYPTGPVELVHNVRSEAFAENLGSADVIHAAYRIAIGLAKVVFVVDIILAGYAGLLVPDPKDYSAVAAASAWIYLYVKFLMLYLNFSGAIDIVIGTGRLFGISLSENFNFPIIATNLQEFWKRWHMSLGRWINLYLFAVLLRRTGQTVLSITLTFTLVGLWHSFTVNYLIWGLFHGTGLSLVYLLGKNKSPWRAAMTTNPAYRLAAWWLTITTVSGMSVFANSASLDAGLSFLSALCGGNLD